MTSLVRDGDRVVGVTNHNVGGSGARVPGEPRCGSRRPPFHGRTHMSRRRITSVTTRRVRCSGGIGTLPRSGEPTRLISSGMCIANTDGHIRVIFQTDHDQLLIGSLPPVEQAMAWRSDPEVALITDLASDATTGPLIAGSAPDRPVRGTLKERYFFEEPPATGGCWWVTQGITKSSSLETGSRRRSSKPAAWLRRSRGNRGRAVSVVASSGRRGPTVTSS